MVLDDAFFVIRLSVCLIIIYCEVNLSKILGKYCVYYKCFLHRKNVTADMKKPCAV
jgi:hypothetical protein